jgi:hypothetical protein
MGNPAGEARGPAPAREIRLTFTPEQWAEIEACAAFDETAPAQWAREAALSWIPETLDAIRAASLPPEARGAEEAKAGAVADAFRRSVAAAEIGLSRDEAAAVALCGAWEGVGFSGFCRVAILAYLEASFSEMACFATGAKGYRHGGKKAKQWAARFHKEAAPIMARLGWNGMTLDPSQITGQGGE